MANHGNSGNRYKLQQIVGTAIEQEPDGLYVRRTLACGHSTRAKQESQQDARWSLQYDQEHIAQGKRTRCMECSV